MTSETESDLPPLPEPRLVRAGHSFPKVYALAYTADQMREYARAAIAVQPPAASLAQAVKAGLATRFPDDPPMEIHPPWCSGGCCNPAAASQPSDATKPGGASSVPVKDSYTFDEVCIIQGKAFSRGRNVGMKYATPQPPAASQPSQPPKTKQVWVAWTNTDLTEGRGNEVPLAVCETEGTARRLGAKGYVMGTQCPVTECTAILSGRHWLVPARIITPTMEDQRLSQLYADQRAAVERAKAAGLSVEDLKLLGAL